MEEIQYGKSMLLSSYKAWKEYQMIKKMCDPLYSKNIEKPIENNEDSAL